MIPSFFFRRRALFRNDSVKHLTTLLPPPQEEQVKTLESSLLRDTANRNRSASCGSLVVSILAVALVNGADFSTFVVFIPLFLSAAFLVCTVSGAICCFRVPPGELDEISSHPGRTVLFSSYYTRFVLCVWKIVNLLRLALVLAGCKSLFLLSHVHEYV